MRDDGKKGGTDSPHKLVDLFQRDSQNHRVFWATVGASSTRKAAARSAWDELDPFQLDEVVFGADFELLTKCIARERSRRQAPTTLPQPSTPEAETLPPTPAPVTTSKADPKPPPPSNFIEQQRAAAVVEPQQLALPQLAEPERAAPNPIIRSALFGLIERGQRKRVENVDVAAWGKTRMLYSGYQLDQADLDVLLQLVHMHISSGAAPGDEVHFTDRGMLKALGRPYGSGGLAWFDQVCREHLSKATLDLVIEGEGDHRINAILSSFTRHTSTGERSFAINPQFLKLFAGDNYALLNWRGRLSLRTSLSKWLHGFLMSHEGSKNGVSLELLKKLAGVPATRPLRKFKADLKQALEELLKLQDLHLGLIDAAVVDGKEGPKLTWKRKGNRRGSLHFMKASDE